MNKKHSTLVLSSFLLLAACSSKAPHDLGLVNDFELRPCPDKPNCVQTYAPTDESHFKQPLIVKESTEETQQAIRSAIVKTGGQVISEKILVPNAIYLHAEYESNWFKFIDDVEVLIKDDIIHIRSASRLGYSDMGANASRFEKIKAVYNQ
tara:strand:+ start:192 stop:644 length:453 start_codon:yes stop_codon:yes gene_type:complete